MLHGKNNDMRLLFKKQLKSRELASLHAECLTNLWIGNGRCLSPSPNAEKRRIFACFSYSLSRPGKAFLAGFVFVFLKLVATINGGCFLLPMGGKR
jgi:hypothetical protein